MCGPRKDAQRVKRKFGEESVKQHHTNAEAAVNFEAMAAKQK